MAKPCNFSEGLNDRIAKAKGWTVERKRALDIQGKPLVWKGQDCYNEFWTDPKEQYQGHKPPDFTGTLEGVAGMMRELQASRKPMSQWAWYWNDKKQRFTMRHAAWLRRFPFRRQVHAIFYSPIDRPGDCVGEAYLSMKEAD